MSEEQTVSTLRFATQAKAIKNHAQVNEVLDDAAKINRMKKEMAAEERTTMTRCREKKEKLQRRKKRQ